MLWGVSAGPRGSGAAGQQAAALWIPTSTERGRKILLFPSALLLCLLNLVQKELTSKAGAQIRNLRGAEYSGATFNPKERLAP